MTKSIPLFALIALFAGFSAASAHAGNFSAFERGGKLIITVMGDGCNAPFAVLDVAAECRKDRAMRNIAVVCNAKLEVGQTAMACGHMKPTPAIMIVDLKDTAVAPEAEELTLTYGQDAVTVKIGELYPR